MVRVKSSFVCQQCNYESGKWMGKCPECGEWNTFVETVVSTRSKIKNQKSNTNSKKPESLSKIEIKKTQRLVTNISELDRVLGGGIVPGQVVLIAGEPGIGKSTILLQVADKLANRDGTFLYVSGEESVYQIKIRAERLGVTSKEIQLLEETDIDDIINTISTFKGEILKGVVVDSIQTMTTSDLSGMAGSVGQIRESTYRLVRAAKSTNTPIIIVGHVTKEGSVAGPAVLAHLVDTVLWFEGDRQNDFRMLRAIKNRFGPTDEVGIFAMEEKGLISLNKTDDLFLTKDDLKHPGSSVGVVVKGTRPFLVEVQSLIVPTNMAFPKRVAQGIDSKRLELLLAVLNRRCGIPTNDFDCFVNIMGGINVKNDPSVDFAVAMSIASAYKNKPVSSKTVFIGELGLMGDIRQVSLHDRRVKEAKRMGYKNVVDNSLCGYLAEVVKKI